MHTQPSRTACCSSGVARKHTLPVTTADTSSGVCGACPRRDRGNATTEKSCRRVDIQCKLRNGKVGGRVAGRAADDFTRARVRRGGTRACTTRTAPPVVGRYAPRLAGTLRDVDTDRARGARGRRPAVGSSGGTAGCGAPGIHHRNFVGSDRPALAPEYPLHVAIFPVRRRVGGSGGWVRLPILFSCCCVQGFPGYSSERARVIGWMFECIERKRCVTLSRSGCVFCFFSLLCRLTRSGCVLCFYCKSAAPRGLSSAKWWLQDAGAGERASRNVGKAADREPIESPV